MTSDLAESLVRRCPVALSLHAERGHFQVASDECARVFARPREQLVGASLFALVDERDRARVQAAWDAATLAGGDVTLRFRVADDVWIETDVRTHDGPDGLTLACASRRVPAPSSAEVDALERQALELARCHRDALVGMLPALVWFGPVSPDLRSYKLSYLNDYLFDLTGWTRQEWFGTPGFWRDLIHPDDRDTALAATEEMMRGERSIGPQYRLRARDGRYIWVRSAIHIERDGAGVPVRMYGITLDVTEFVAARERSEALLRELEDKTRGLLELSAPVIPLGDALILPLIGVLDPARADHASTTLLRAIHETRARRVVIDLTGVRALDHESAAAITRMAAAARLLGVTASLTGVRAEVARRLLELGQPLGELKSHLSLAAALHAT